jgi:hypothetical protein
MPESSRVGCFVIMMQGFTLRFMQNLHCHISENPLAPSHHASNRMNPVPLLSFLLFFRNSARSMGSQSINPYYGFEIEGKGSEMSQEP